MKKIFLMLFLVVFVGILSSCQNIYMVGESVPTTSSVASSSIASSSINNNSTSIADGEKIIRVENGVTDVYDMVKPSCISIQTTSTSGAAIGSAVIYKKSGLNYYALTNNHVVTDNGVIGNVKVYITGKLYSATVLGTDPITDLAVVEFVYSGTLPTVKILSNQSEVFVGQTVLAIGSPLTLANYNYLSVGNISKIYDGYYYHSATINPGNSGGGLFNLKGELIGLNNEKIVFNGDGDYIFKMGRAISADTLLKKIAVLEK